MNLVRANEWYGSAWLNSSSAAQSWRFAGLICKQELTATNGNCYCRVHKAKASVPCTPPEWSSYPLLPGSAEMKALDECIEMLAVFMQAEVLLPLSYARRLYTLLFLMSQGRQPGELLPVTVARRQRMKVSCLQQSSSGRGQVGLQGGTARAEEEILG